MAHYPKPIEESIAQAAAAASRAAVTLSKDRITVEGVVSNVKEFMCRGCGECERACPFNAISVQETDKAMLVAVVKEALCKGCGMCAVACPTGAASVHHFDDREVLTMVETAFEY
jgi:heterodisulfide reductase subunit A